MFLRPVFVETARAVLKYRPQFNNSPICSIRVHNNQLFDSNLKKYFNTMSDQVVTYEDVVGYKDDPRVLLIDVREPNELQETGTIPSSINIPLGELSNALHLTPEAFKEKYGREFPRDSQQIVFSCKLGGRAKNAMAAALALGYGNAKYYKGSWTEWESKQK